MTSPTRDPATPEETALAAMGALLLEAELSVTDVREALLQIWPASSTEPAPPVAVLPAAVLVGSAGAQPGTAMAIVPSQSLTIRQGAHAIRLAHGLAGGGIRLDGADARIRAIRRMRLAHPDLAWVLGSALVSGGLSLVFRCPWWAIAASTLVGLLLAVVTAVMGRVRPAAALVPFVAAFLSTTAMAAIDALLGLGPIPLFAVCAPFAILVPGALITNALLELTATDIVTGSARLMYGLIVLGFMYVGIVAGSTVTGVHVDERSSSLVGETIAGSAGPGWGAAPPASVAWVGVVGLALGVCVAFGSGIRLAVVSVVVMLCTYGLLTVLTPAFGAPVATGAVGAVLFVAARLLERMPLGVPASVMFRPAFLLLVPGTVGLVALASLGSSSAEAAVLTFVSLCIGVKAGSVMVDTDWAGAFRRRMPRRYRP
ncbi:threonine/serine exporter family protein [Microbacterium mangrovi]|uniref:threonine/serine exporter family protein n=1 Tax=Microbacterium mangrovi TaxID=1348253 RepID=UPI000690B86E|nr:threonine/serine exporter family protein [Microbacterium mangrovi]